MIIYQQLSLTNHLTVLSKQLPLIFNQDLHILRSSYIIYQLYNQFIINKLNNNKEMAHYGRAEYW